jgi:hypothetical protein
MPACTTAVAVDRPSSSVAVDDGYVTVAPVFVVASTEMFSGTPARLRSSSKAPAAGIAAAAYSSTVGSGVPPDAGAALAQLVRRGEAEEVVEVVPVVMTNEHTGLPPVLGAVAPRAGVGVGVV